MSREQKSGCCFFKKGRGSQAEPSWGEGSVSPSPHIHRHPSFWRLQARAATQPFSTPVCVARGRREASCRAWRRGGGLGRPASSTLSAAGAGEPRPMRGTAAPDPGSPREQSKARGAAASYPPQASAISEVFVVAQRRPGPAGPAWPPQLRLRQRAGVKLHLSRVNSPLSPPFSLNTFMGVQIPGGLELLIIVLGRNKEVLASLKTLRTNWMKGFGNKRSGGPPSIGPERLSTQSCWR